MKIPDLLYALSLYLNNEDGAMAISIANILED